MLNSLWILSENNTADLCDQNIHYYMHKFLCVQENALITQARTNVLVILDTVDATVASTLMNAILHLADMVS